MVGSIRFWLELAMKFRSWAVVGLCSGKVRIYRDFEVSAARLSVDSVLFELP